MGGRWREEWEGGRWELRQREEWEGGKHSDHNRSQSRLGQAVVKP